jgi:magnesium chelatase subunit D
MDAVRAALLGLLVDAYQRRDRVALVTFGGRGAEVVLRPTGSVEVARARLADLRTGGDTPLGDGIRAAADLAERSATPTLRPLLVVVTDGRATAGPRPWQDAAAAAEAVRRRGLAAVVIDVEAGHVVEAGEGGEAGEAGATIGAVTGGPSGRSGPELGLAAELAHLMVARHLPLPAFSAGRLEATLRRVAGAEPSR